MRLVAAAVLCSCLAVAVAAVDRAPRAVSQQCPVPTQETILVEPVLSPTDRLTQTVGARFGAYGERIKVVTESGVFANTQVPGDRHAAVNIRLLPDVTHHLTVSGNVALGGGSGPCPRIEYELATTLDLNGAPLVIAQSAQATPSATPSPDMLHDIQVYGDVVALGTPVSARILLHPSDGRCPWSDGYRSGEDGRFDRTCSDARQGSTIDVWVLGDHHYPWSQSYEVERGVDGAKPVDVRAILTARPAGASPTPTVVDEIGQTRWFANVVAEGGVPVPWASVSLHASGYGVSCLSPVNTDDAGHFEVWCFGGHSMYTDFRLGVRASGCEPWEAAMGRVSTGDVRLRDIELVCATSTPTPTGTPPTPTATVTAWNGEGEPSPSYLPVVLRNTARESMATAAASPPTATLRPDEYFFLETWSHQERGPGCYMLYVDYPTYSFDEETGVLQVNGLDRLNPRLEQSDIGYLGSGSSLSGRGSGDSSHLATFDSTPFVFEDLELRSFDGSGSVTLKRGTEVILLESGGEWQRTWSGESPGEPGCVVTDTRRIRNYGLQDRRKIVYSAAGCAARTRQARAWSRAEACA